MSFRATNNSKIFLVSACVLTFLLALPFTSAAGTKKRLRIQPQIGEGTTPVSLDVDLRTLPQTGPVEKNILLPELKPDFIEEREAQPIPLDFLDPAKEAAPAPPNMPSPDQNFPGLNFALNGAGWPPDTNGDVGPSHYIQVVNTSIGIYNKTGTALSTVSFNTFFSGAAAPCNTSNMGDPVALYDAQSGRWLIADFAWTNLQNGPYYMCIAMSKTSDPVAGGWWLYTYRADDASHPWLNDYPKIGAWNDAFYMTANMFDCLNSNCSSANFKGVRAYALNRDDLTSGAALRSVVFDLGASTYSIFPGNYRGTAPPAGEPNFLLSLDPFGASQLDLYKFHVDWTTPANSTFTGPTVLSTTAFTSYTGTVPESGGEALDSLGDRAMVQLQYRNISGTESLWISHTVTSGGVAGVRWYEIRSPNSSPSIFQQGTFQPDSSYRWMPSLAVDQNGNMAIGYSVSSSSLFPQIRYAGRLVSDTAGTLGQGEATLIAGTGSQNGGFNRWGDYSLMSIDPVDGCTFWYTNEYYASTGNNWQTRIGSFKFASCGASCPTITVSTSTTNPSCNGASTGSITVSATGGTAPLQYSKDNGVSYQSSNVFSSLAAGTYNIVVKDANNCTSTATPVSLTNPPAINFTTSKTAPACPGNSNGSITVSASGGTGTLQYSKDNGVTFQASNIFSGLAAGTYNIVVKDANSCTTPASAVSLSDPPAITFTTTPVNPACHGSSNGSITVNASGGTGSLQYSKDNGLTFQASNIFSGLAAGSYNIVVKDANSCTTSATQVTLTDPSTVTFTTSPVNPACNGAATGSITVNASGGTGTFQYSKDNGVTFQASNVFTALTAGTYNIVVKDSNNCTTSASPVTLTNPPAITFTTNKTDPTCHASSTGSITVNASGGTGTLQYSKDNGVTFQASNVFGSLAAGTYPIVVKDANSCTTPSSGVTLTDPPALTFTTAHADPTCHSSTDGTITVTASGGTGTLLYSDDNGSTFQASNVFTGLAGGNYNIVVKDANNCTTAATLVALTDPPAIAFTTSPANPDCHGSSTGSITVNASGGTGALQYSKDNGVTFQPSNVFTNLAAGTYNIVVKDANSCTTSATPVSLTDPPLIAFSVATVNPLCASSATGSITVTASGGTGTLQYSKDDGVTFQASNIFTGLTAGIYDVVVRDSNNCTTAATQVVLVDPPAINFTTSPVDPTCSTSTDGSITVNASGGTGSLSYSDDGGATFQASNVFPALSAGTYNVVVKDANNCTTAPSPVTLTSTGTAPAVTTNPGSQTVAAGTLVSFTASASGTPAPAVQWQKSTDGGATFTDLSGETAATLSFTATAADNGNQYRAVFTNNCGTDTTQPATLTVTAACLFCDDFEDGVLATPTSWRYKPNTNAWSETGGQMIAAPAKKTESVATPIFAGCLNCYVETTVTTTGGPLGRIWLFGWYVDKNNMMQVMMKETSDRWVLKERSGGKMIMKAKAISPINVNQAYTVRLTYNGSQFVLTVDGTPMITMTPAAAVPAGTVGFRVKATTAKFDYIMVN